MRPGARYRSIERGALIVALIAIVFLGVTSRVRPPPKPAVMAPESAPHPEHPTLQCAACHSRDAKRSVEPIVCADCHDPMQSVSAELDKARDAYFAGGCAACHPIDGQLRRARPGPDLREARMKLTREWTYRFLTEPWAWDPQAPPGPHHLLIEKDAAAMTAKVRAIVTGLVGNRDRAALQVHPSELGERLLKEQKCFSCHDLGRSGSKLGRAWLDAFLRQPRAHAADAKHPDPHWTPAEISAVSEALLSDRDGVFEPRWPVLDRATVDATDALVDKYGLDMQSAAQAKKEAALGAKIMAAEGCEACHALLGPDPAPHTITRDPRKKDRAHAVRYTLSADDALAFVKAQRRFAKSAWWPRPRLPSAEGAALGREVGCVGCHDTYKATTVCEWEQALGDKRHDFGLSVEAKRALIGHFGRDQVCQQAGQ